MAKLLFNDLPQYLDGNGDPYAGAQLFSYAAGSSTKQTLYQDSAGSTAHANPIVLDANGRVPAAIWATEGVTYKLILAPSDDTDPPASPIFTIDNLAGINDASVALDQWSDSGLTATYISATQFSVAGDQTTDLEVGRRVKVVDAGGTKYGYITVSAYTTLTTVTVVLDSGSLSNPISSLSLGVQTVTNPSEPLQTDDYPLRSGSSDRTKKVRIEVDGLTTATTRVATVPDYDIRLGNLPAGIGPLPYAGSTIPTGWLECDGSAISRTTYAALFTAISTTWGAGDGSTTFNLPDFRGRTPIGAGTGTATASGVNADVDTTADTLTVASNNSKWVTGMTVVFTLASGTITGLSSGSTYYVIRASSTTIKLASSLANAQNGTAIDLTAKSSPVWTITYTLTARTLGNIGGEEAHAMSSTELLSHTHALSNASTILTAVPSGTPTGGAADAGATASISSTGGNAAMNIMQPYGVVKMIISY